MKQGRRKMNVFSYLDYRKLLKEAYENKKTLDNNFNYRILAKEAGYTSAGFFSNILNGKRNISENMAKKLCRVFGFNTKEANYFQLLVKADQSKSPYQRKIFFDQALLLSHSSLGVKQVGSHQFYEKWYYSAVREAITTIPFTGDYKVLAKSLHPAIKPKEAKQSIELLLELGMIEQAPDGQYIQTNPYISSGDKITSANLSQFHKQTAQLAENAIDDIPRELRNISTLTLGLSSSGYEEIITKMRTFRKELLEVAKKEQGKDRVYHLNFHVFPMSKIKKTKKNSLPNGKGEE